MNGLVITCIEFDGLTYCPSAAVKFLPQQFTVVLNDSILLVGTLKQYPARIAIEYPNTLKGNGWAHHGKDVSDWIRVAVIKAWEEFKQPVIDLDKPKEIEE